MPNKPQRRGVRRLSESLASDSADEATWSATIAGIVFLGIGYLIGGGIEGDQRFRSAIEWATTTAQRCEKTYRADGYSSVTDCLRTKIAKAEEAAREEKRADGYDPRR